MGAKADIHASDELAEGLLRWSLLYVNLHYRISFPAGEYAIDSPPCLTGSNCANISSKVVLWGVVSMMILPGFAVTLTIELTVMPDTLAIGGVIRTPKPLPHEKRCD